MTFFLTSGNRKGGLVLLGATLLLIGFIGFLVAANYQSHRRVQEFALDQLLQNTEEDATALGYYCSERKDDVNNLAASRSILAFFENRALGMSMEYGLRASLLGISESFDRLLREREIEGERIYTRIVFIDRDGKLLVDTRTGTKGKEDERDWKGLLSPKSPGARISVERKRRLEVVAAIPYFFKGAYTGRIVAWISPKTMYCLAKRGKGSSGRFVYIACEKYQILAPPDTPFKDSFSTLPELGSLKVGEIHRIKTHEKDGATVELIALRVPVKGAPLSVVALLPAPELEGRIAFWYLPLGMGILAVLILCGAAAAYRINTQRLVLNTRLDEASKARREIEEKVKKRTAALSREIEDRKEAEAELKASENRIRSLIEASPVGICIHQRGMYVYANPAFVRIFGYEHSDEIVGRPVESLFHPEDRGLITKSGKERLEGNKMPLSYDVKGLKKEGKSFAAALWGTVIDYQKDHAILGFVADMSAERELRSQLQESQKMEALGNLAGGIAHDFNNILSAIIGYAELAKMKVSEEGSPLPDLNEVLKAGDRAKKLIGQILTMSRETGDPPKPITPIYIVNEALDLLRASVPTFIKFDLRIEKDTGTILADATRIHQVIMNLGTNAQHAMGEEGGTLGVGLKNVEVDARAAAYLGVNPGPYVKLTVSDTGRGMPPEIRERIFEPYYTTKEKGVGTGLGLSVVHGIIEGYGGKISVYSEPGKGSTFHVYFPRIDGASETIIKSGAPALLPAGTERILFVDDEKDLVDISRQMLERLGYEVTALTNSIEALERFSEDPGRFDLVITDLSMPDMTGEKLVREILNIRPGMPVIMCSGFDATIRREKAGELGAKAFIRKPLTFEKLARAVREALDD